MTVSSPKSTPRTKPAQAKPKATETKPAETKPAETKPAETKPAETKPAEVKADVDAGKRADARTVRAAEERNQIDRANATKVDQPNNVVAARGIAPELNAVNPTNADPQTKSPVERAAEETRRIEAERANVKPGDKDFEARAIAAHKKLADLTAADTRRALETRNQEERQQIVDRLSRAAELAGPKGARKMGKAAVEAGGRNVGDLSSAIRNSVESGNGALFGVETANAAGSTAKNQIASAVGRGIQKVKADYDAAKAGLQKQDARFAEFMATHGASLTDAQKEKAQKAFNEYSSAERAKFEAASEKLLSVGQGADRARNTSVGAVMDNNVGGVRDTLRDVRSEVPTALKTDAGQRYLKSALNAPAGQLPSHLVPENKAEANKMAGALATAILGSEQAQRRALIDKAGTHGEQLGMPELSDNAVKRSLERIGDGKTPAEIKSGLGALGGALKALGKTSLTPTGALGAVLGLGAATLAGLDGNGVREVSEAIAKGGHALSNIASEVLEGLGNSSRVSAKFAEGAQRAAAIAEGAGKVLGRFAGAFDGFNTVSALARGDGAQATISALSAAGAILSTTSRRALGGGLGLAAAGLQLGYDIYRNVQERTAYEKQATAVFKSLGFNDDGARGLASIRHDSRHVIDALGRGVGPGGGNLSRAEVLERLKSFDAYDPRVLNRLNNVFDDFSPADFNAPGTGVSARDMALRTLWRMQSQLFGRRAA